MFIRGVKRQVVTSLQRFQSTSIRPGDFAIIETVNVDGHDARATIDRVLSPQQINEFIREGIWPRYFLAGMPGAIQYDYIDSSSESDDELFWHPHGMHQNFGFESSDENSAYSGSTEADV